MRNVSWSICQIATEIQSKKGHVLAIMKVDYVGDDAVKIKQKCVSPVLNVAKKELLVLKINSAVLHIVSLCALG